VTPALALSDIQVLDAPQAITSSLLQESDETADVHEIPHASDEDAEEVVPQDCSTRGLLPEWDAFGLHDRLIRALFHQSFTKPTPIQLEALPPALRKRDVVGVAETVRGRILPFPTNTYIGTGIGKNPGLWITYPTQIALAEEAPDLEDSQTSARVNPSSDSRTRASNIVTLERLLE
jgi:hypothetical protein